LRANQGSLLDRDDVFGELHGKWTGDGGIMLRDVDMCAARLAFGHPGIVVSQGKTGLLR
jgi:hypothetical protein